VERVGRRILSDTVLGDQHCICGAFGRFRDMGKYDPLRDYLKRQKAEELELSFEEIERVLGAMLPNGASRPQWWTMDAAEENPPVQHESWRGAGFQASLITGKDRVRFVRLG
jgi:hypothetical protein